MALLTLLVLWKIPQLQVKYATDIVAKDRFSSENEARKTLATILGGFVVVLGAYFTWRTIRISQEGQITDRFTKAIEHLGAVDQDGKKKMELRLGGIYALERIAVQFESEWPILEVLCTYIRANAPCIAQELREEDQPPSQRIAADMQAILTFLGGRDYEHGRAKHHLDLSYTDLRNADLRDADLRSAILKGADLRGARLHSANLSSTDLRNANLSWADLGEVNLRWAILQHAILDMTELGWADLHNANLSDAKLIDTKLQAADLSDVKLVDAELVRTLLSGAKLCRADLSGADIRANLGSADLSGANLGGAEIVEANFGSANLRGADLGGATIISPLGLTQAQIDSAKGNVDTTLPNNLKMPESWKGQ